MTRMSVTFGKGSARSGRDRFAKRLNIHLRVRTVCRARVVRAAIANASFVHHRITPATCAFSAPRTGYVHPSRHLYRRGQQEEHSEHHPLLFPSRHLPIAETLQASVWDVDAPAALRRRSLHRGPRLGCAGRRPTGDAGRNA